MVEEERDVCGGQVSSRFEKALAVDVDVDGE